MTMDSCHLPQLGFYKHMGKMNLEQQSHKTMVSTTKRTFITSGPEVYAEMSVSVQQASDDMGRNKP